MKTLREVFQTELTYRRRKIEYLQGDLGKVPPGSGAHKRILAALKVAETEAGLWEGRLKELGQ